MRLQVLFLLLTFTRANLLTLSSSYSSEQDALHLSQFHCSSFSSNELCSSLASSPQQSKTSLCQFCSSSLLRDPSLSSPSASSSLDVNLTQIFAHHPQCQIGFSRAGSVANPFQTVEDQCIKRGYENRPNLYSFWKGEFLDYRLPAS
jgi:hypothetical protein